MSQQDQQKLLEAGFTIIRTEWNMTAKSGRIKYCHSPGSWRNHSKYTSQASMERALKELLIDSKTIEA